MSKTGETWYFTYDANGMRTGRTGKTAYTYFYDGGLLTHMTCGNKTLHFTYSPTGSPVSVTYDGATYYYILSLQGDVMGLKDSSGQTVVAYVYDAWGRLLSTEGDMQFTLGLDNPLRYRGYVYDRETGLYYLESRYYNPAIGRWINADIPETLTAYFQNFAQYNLFAFCFNNPVNMSDENGTWPSWVTKLAIGVSAIVVGAAVVAATTATGGTATVFFGAVVAGLKTAALSGAVAAGTSATITAIESITSGNDVKTTIKKAALAAVDSFADGFMWGGTAFGSSHAAGYVTSKTGIFKRDVKYGKNNFFFGTNELTIWRHGPNFRIDASATRGLHYHLRTAKTGIGKHRNKWIPEIIGCASGLFSVFNR